MINCNNIECEFNYWCETCGMEFCSCSGYGDKHDSDLQNIGHKVYDYHNRGTKEPLYVVDDELKASIGPIFKPYPINIQEDVKILIKMLNDNKIPSPANISFVGSAARFSINGPRNSIVIYKVWGRGIVDVWFGKDNDDSGGLAKQGSLINSRLQLKNIIQLHRRFYQSGRRKVLRNARRY